MIRALMAVFLIAGVVGAALAGSAEEQLKQDVYEKIMRRALGSVITGGMGEGRQDIGKKNMGVYRKIKETKVLASCIYWNGNSVEDLRTGIWWSTFNTFRSKEFLGDLRRRALNNCKSTAKGKGQDCKCQIVDENDKNKLKLPKKWKERVLTSKEGNFRSANLEGTSFRNANLQGFNFEGANLRKVNFTFANLQKANLDGASLVNAYLQRAYLQGASFRNANFQKAMLNAADLLGANFQGADLSGARGLTQEQLDKACGDENTKLPKNLTMKRCPKDGE